MRGVWRATGLLALLALGSLPPARAQEVDLGPLPRPVVIYLRERSLVTAQLVGDYGPVRVTGTLQTGPNAKLSLTDAVGRVRQAGWDEVRAMTRVEFPSEGFPVGSYRISLISDPANPTSNTGATYSATVLTPVVGGWRLLTLPEGSLALQGEPYGSFQFPLTRVTSLAMEPIRGNSTELPQGNIRLEVLNGAVMSLPLQNLQWFQRDTTRGTITLTLNDDQTFTGKLVELPRVTVALENERGKQSVPLDRIAQLERTAPGSRRF